MENYDAYSPNVFMLSPYAVEKLETDKKMNTKFYKTNLMKIKAMFGASLIDFTIKTIPKHLKRNRYDSAMLLAFKDESGQWFAKRHNNSQFLNIEY
jgi:hypothetical protein